MPTTIKFGKQFRKSPFKPLRKHMRIASETATFLPDAMQAFFRNDSEALQETRQAVSELAADADLLLKELQQRLPDERDMTLERRDLLDVLEMQEAIARRMQEITALLPDLPMDVSRDMRKPLTRLVDRCVAATEVAYEIVKSIEKVVEAGFKGAQLDAARQLVQDVVVIRSEADVLCGEITRMLFAQCREMDPLAVMFLYQLLGWIDDLANSSQKLAIRSQLLLVR
jgi:predicted phosphate transport protein (TIGR00153 family)